MKRSLSPYIQKDSDIKMILLSGPRQSGKTTLVKSLFSSSDYLNFDESDDRLRIFKKHWHRNVDALIFDELHKMKDWKRWIKGIYDTRGNRPRIIVTGSARFDAFRKVGDSLAGRHLSFRMHPIDIQEGCLYWNDDPRLVMERILRCSGFPEPFLNDDPHFYRRWQRTHLDIILRQDFLDIYSIRQIKSLEILVDLLKERTASPLSYSSLAQDLQVDHKTIKSWIDMLENVYTVFRVTPFHKNIARAILKEPKLYFYDVGRIADKGAQLENLVAASLLKQAHFLEDTQGYKTDLHYLRTRDGHEIDFCVCIDNQPVLAIEVKTTDETPSPAFRIFSKYLQGVRKVQLVKTCQRPFSTLEDVQVCDLATFLKTLNFADFVSR